ncbi:MAG: PilZ domain-containing protein [Acidobacteria bacterium]|nr:PilZ domain-containing protein [Acidobacteriota bacterium]
MLRIERIGKRLLAFRNLKQRPIAEFYDLTDFIVNSPDEFFGEIGEKVFLIGTHAKLGRAEGAPVDLLGVDASGAGVAAVIEATAEESALSRAIRAASRLAAWEPPQFFERLTDQRSRALRTFLGSNMSQLNKRQRVFIIGEKADEELMSAAAWLFERGVDIVFVEASLAVEPHSGAEYLRCHAFNPQEARQAARRSEREPAYHSADPKLQPMPAAEEALEAEVEAPPEPDWTALDLDDSPFPQAAAPEPEAEAEPEPEPIPEPEPEPATPERRSTPRESVEADRVVEVEYAGRRLGAHLTDYSPTGVALEMNSPLPIGSTVLVIGQLARGEKVEQVHRKGRVRYCRFEEQGFRLGVALEQGS